MKKHFTLEIKSDSDDLAAVEDFVTFIAQEANLDEVRGSGLLLAVTEATTNAIIHGNKRDSNKMVHISVFLGEDELFISVKDEGEGFDPAIVPDPTHPENLMKDHGRGLYLMRIYAEELSYTHSAEGTTASLRINLKK